MEGKQKKILVVDDEPDILDFLRVVLEEEGYVVTTTVRGEYLEKLQNNGLPDVILLDMVLSGKNGRDILEYIKGGRETRHIPIIMFSAYPSAEETARMAGADDFVAKPFDIDILLTRIARFA
jgi:DNA-binding response OmpR family regulator